MIHDLDDKDLLTRFIHAVEIKGCREVYGDRRDKHKYGQPKKREDSYRYIPLDVGCFLSTLRIIRDDYYKHNDKNGPYPTFLDAGCGLGVKMILASLMRFNSHGVEIDRKLIKQAKKMFRFDSPKNPYPWCYPVHTPRIKYQSILTHNYHDYDVIYFYRPLQNNDKQIEFEKRIHSQMKKGAYLAPFMQSISPPTKQFKRIKAKSRLPIYRKK